MLSDIFCRKKGKQIKGTVVIMKKKNSFDFNDFSASVCDRLSECAGQGVSLRLISARNADPEKGLKGKIGKAAYVEGWISKFPSLTADKSEFEVHFVWEDEVGIPGAFQIENKHFNEFFLVSLTLEGVPNQGSIHFSCNSWVYPANKYQKPRIFFANKTYLPSDTPGPLRKYRDEELSNLRGHGEGELQEWDRVYDYSTYNDLGKPDKSLDYARPILGGSSKHPYPRRGRTNRPPTKKDPKCESRVKLWSSIYVPRDERFAQIKNSDFTTFELKSVSKIIKPSLERVYRNKEFDSFQDVLNLYKGGLKLPKSLLRTVSDSIPAQKVKEVFRIDGEHFLKFPVPQVISDDQIAWMTDEEFAREMLAGVNPVKICCLREFPPKSKLDSTIYGDHSSKITKEDIMNNLDGLNVEEAIKEKRLFLLDYHDDFMPYLSRINATHDRAAYASRTILFLKNDGTLKPLAIELSLPHPDGDQFGAKSRVYLPVEQGVECSLWKLAKAYVVVNDSGYHQLISHWLHTHAVIEPFIIATHRQLSILHPICKLLLPHFRDTMNINALARQSLINANGIIESTFFPGKYAMELSSAVYKEWVFTEQALPADLVKRGMAVGDPDSPYGLRLVIEDYPYAVDGLDIWFAIKTWVHDYCSFYYTKDDIVQHDSELQSWWKELVKVGHGDKKDEQWWPEMQTREELIESCTIIVWLASAFHAAVNFGQYPYGGYILNRPTMSRDYMPQSLENIELQMNLEKAFLSIVTPKAQTLTALSVLAILSRHSSNESYLGERDMYWTSDEEPLEAFEKFKRKLRDIEERINRDNIDEKLKNRHGPINMPYTLLYPTSEAGLTGKGIPNSISI